MTWRCSNSRTRSERLRRRRARRGAPSEGQSCRHHRANRRGLLHGPPGRSARTPASRYARARAGSVLVIDVDDLGAVRGRGPHAELGLSLLRCPADETRQASRPPSGSNDPRCCDEKGVTACAGRSDAPIARIPHRPTERSASTARVGAGMRAGNGADVVDLEQPPGSISPRGGHERRPAGADSPLRGDDLRGWRTPAEPP